MITVFEFFDFIDKLGSVQNFGRCRQVQTDWGKRTFTLHNFFYLRFVTSCTF